MDILRPVDCKPPTNTNPKQVFPMELRWKAPPMEAIARDMITPEVINSGLRPARSTTNREEKLLATWTAPTMMVAK